MRRVSSVVIFTASLVASGVAIHSPVDSQGHVTTFAAPNPVVSNLLWASHKIGQALGVEKDDDKVVKVVRSTVEEPAAPAKNATKATNASVASDVKDMLADAEEPEDTMTEEAMDGAEVTFVDLDCIKRDNNVTIDEAATWGVRNGVPWSEIKPLFGVVDTNGDHIITNVEFEAGKPFDEALMEDFRAGFRDVDLDGNGMISKLEWDAWCEGWMSPRPTPEVCEELFRVSDTEQPKGEIDAKEFEEGGKECKSVDDGDCSKLLQAKSNSVARGTAGTALRNSHQHQHQLHASLSSWFTSHMRTPKTVADLFTVLKRRNMKKSLHHH